MSVKKVKQGEGTLLTKEARSLHKEVQDLLTKGDTRSPHKRNV